VTSPASDLRPSLRPVATHRHSHAVGIDALPHVPNLDQGIADLWWVIRPGGRLIATTGSRLQLAELWELVGRDRSDRDGGFTRENGEQRLAKRFATVRRRDLDTTIRLTATEIRDYVGHSVRHQHLAARVPDLSGPLMVTAADSVFIATK
jgi:hypothetical protein